MIRFLLHTDACLSLIRGRWPRMLERLRRCRAGSVGLSSLSLAELYEGAARSSNPSRNMAALAHFCAPLRILPFDDRASAAYGPLREDLEEKLGPHDTLIAAHALALDVALVTDNEREFRRVRGLDVRNWGS